MSRALQKVAFLRQTALFSELPSNDLEALSLRVRERTYRRHETVFHLDDPGTALLLIRTGRVKVTLTSKEGKEIILRIAGPGEIVGEVALLDGQPRSATVAALEKLEVFLLDRDALIEFISQHPDAALKLLAVLSWTIRRSNDRIGALAFSDAYGKVAQVLLDLVSKHGQPTGSGIEVAVDLTRQEMASLAGVSRETFTRILKLYSQAGLLKIDRRCLHILSKDRLSLEVL